MDSIRIESIRAYGYHGMYQKERESGQHFAADVTLCLPLDKAGASDALEDTVDYAAVISTVREVLSGPARQTIEAVAESIAAAVLEGFPPVCEISLTVFKPEAPIKDFDGRVSVSIHRRRVS
ncbi:MAG: dihydroneopterin aldolase [Puniceicoccales bacterium]